MHDPKFITSSFNLPGLIETGGTIIVIARELLESAENWRKVTESARNCRKPIFFCNNFLLPRSNFLKSEIYDIFFWGRLSLKWQNSLQFVSYYSLHFTVLYHCKKDIEDLPAILIINIHFQDIQNIYIKVRIIIYRNWKDSEFWLKKNINKNSKKKWLALINFLGF